MPGRRSRIAFAGALITGTLLSATTPAVAGMVPAAAAPSAPLSTSAGRRFAPAACASLPPPAAMVADLPWPQRRYPLNRLDALATGAGVTVAVIDSGVDADHPQLRGRVIEGADYLDAGSDGTLDCVGHGTAVASIIAAAPRSGVGLRGLAPKATILPVRVSEQQIIDGQESGRTVPAAGFAQAIRWAVDHGADVLNLSVVLYADGPAVRAAIGYAIERDVVVVAAVGNLHENGDPRPYPAAYAGVLGVGAIGADGVRSAFSQVGSYVDLVAPGGEVLAATTGRGHKRQNGTSYATPFVAATAALIRQYQPELSARQVAARILATADPAPGGARSDAYGTGVLNPYRALTDTTAVGVAPAPVVLSDTPTDPAAIARADRRARSQRASLGLAVAGGAIAGLAVLLAVVLPRGARRRWRPAGSGQPGNRGR